MVAVARATAKLAVCTAKTKNLTKTKERTAKMTKFDETKENYLETIHVLIEKLGRIRAIDVCNHLNYSKPTVSVALKNLQKDDYIYFDGSFIYLTEKGLAVAEKIYERHNVLAEFFIKLGVSENTAYEDSCKIEHFLSEESFAKIKEKLNER